MAKRGFMDGYKRYDPSKAGYGSAREWRHEFSATMGMAEADQVLGSKTPEGVLGIDAGATWPVIQSAYRKAVMACHPDRCAVHGLSVAVATERFKIVTAAFVKLKAKHRR